MGKILLTGVGGNTGQDLGNDLTWAGHDCQIHSYNSI